MNLGSTRLQRCSQEIDARWFWLPCMIALGLLSVVLLLSARASQPAKSGPAPGATVASSTELPAPLAAAASTSMDLIAPMPPQSGADQPASP